MAAKGWNELVWSSDHDRTSLSRAAGRGTLARLSPGLYTSAVTDAPADVVRRNLHTIVAHELPGAVIADRSARHGGKPIDGELYVVHRRDRPLALPGVTILPLASISSAPLPDTAPIAAIRPALIATSPSIKSPPVPSAIVPPRITRS